MLRPRLAVRSTELVCSVKVGQEDCVWRATDINLSPDRIRRIAKVVHYMPYIEHVRIRLDTKRHPHSLGCNGLYSRPCSFGEYILNEMLTAVSESGLVGSQNPASLRHLEVVLAGDDIQRKGRVLEFCIWTETDGLHVYIEAAKQCGTKIFQVNHRYILHSNMLYRSEQSLTRS